MWRSSEFTDSRAGSGSFIRRSSSWAPAGARREGTVLRTDDKLERARPHRASGGAVMNRRARIPAAAQRAVFLGLVVGLAAAASGQIPRPADAPKPLSPR